MKKLTNKFLIVLILVVSLTGCMQHKNKILIIGDSISLGYTSFVQENLKKTADVYHNPGNAQHTGTGLENIKDWIGDEEWDIIQFNWGLWDLCYRHPDSKEQGNRDKINGEITFNTDDYGSNLDSIVKLIKTYSDAKLIFVTTSYVPDNEAGRYKEDAITYNQIAKKIMLDNDIIINDIYETSMSIHHKYAKDTNDVHYLEEGYKELGLHISDFLKKEL